LTRLLIRHEPIDEAYVLSVFELVLAGTNAVAASAAPAA
jgi:hypothetical protein